MGYKGKRRESEFNTFLHTHRLNPNLPLNPETGSFRLELRTPNQTWLLSIQTSMPKLFQLFTQTRTQPAVSRCQLEQTKSKCFQIRFPTVHNVSFRIVSYRSTMFLNQHHTLKTGYHLTVLISSLRLTS